MKYAQKRKKNMNIHFDNNLDNLDDIKPIKIFQISDNFM